MRQNKFHNSSLAYFMFIIIHKPEFQKNVLMKVIELILLKP